MMNMFRLAARAGQLLSSGKTLAAHKSKLSRVQYPLHSSLTSITIRDEKNVASGGGQLRVVVPEVLEPVREAGRKTTGPKRARHILLDIWNNYATANKHAIHRRCRSTDRATRQKKMLPTSKRVAYLFNTLWLSRCAKKYRQNVTHAHEQRSNDVSVVAHELTRKPFHKGSNEHVKLLTNGTKKSLMIKNGSLNLPAGVLFGLALWWRDQRVFGLTIFAGNRKKRVEEPVEEDLTTSIMMLVFMALICIWALSGVIDDHRRPSRTAHSIETQSISGEGAIGSSSGSSTESKSDFSVRQITRPGNRIHFPLAGPGFQQEIR